MKRAPGDRGEESRPNEVTQPFRTQSDRDAIAAYFWRRGNFRDYALFVFGINTGRRIGDILALDVGDVAKIDKKGRFVVLDRLKIREEKTQKAVSLPINETARRALGKYLGKRKRTAAALGALLLEPLFRSQKPRQDGQYRITERHALHILTEAARACGLDYRVGTHSLRKTFGYMAFQATNDITRIQKAFNHSSPAITLAYIGITQEDIDELYYAIEGGPGAMTRDEW